MARPANHHPTERELDILQVLWDRKSASLGEVCETLCQDREVAKTTVATLLKLMEDKRLVERTPDRRWRALVSRTATSTKMVKGLMDKLFDGSAGRLVAHVLKAGSLSEADLAELSRLLEAAEPQRDPKVTGS
jgi:predicted transcriptional regulator